MIGERRGKAKLKPNNTDDRYELRARDSGNRKERLPEFCLFLQCVNAIPLRFAEQRREFWRDGMERCARCRRRF
jgi:hypothetical protein